LVFAKLKSTRKLPSPKGVALKIFQLAKDSDVTIEEISSLVETDPATAARLLQFANSSLVGASHKIASVSQAIVLLGISNVTNIALSCSLIDENKRGWCAGFDYNGFWSGSLARAVAARYLANLADIIHPEEAFTCGLLSQVGRLALAAVFPEEYGKLVSFTKIHEGPMVSKLERQKFQIDHLELTSLMLADWNLPDYFCEAVLHQEAPSSARLEPESQTGRLTRILHLGDLLATIFLKGTLRCSKRSNLLIEAEQACLEPDTVPRAYDSILNIWQEMGPIFSITTHSVPSWKALQSRIS